MEGTFMDISSLPDELKTILTTMIASEPNDRKGLSDTNPSAFSSLRQVSSSCLQLSRHTTFLRLNVLSKNLQPVGTPAAPRQVLTQLLGTFSAVEILELGITKRNQLNNGHNLFSIDPVLQAVCKLLPGLQELRVNGWNGKKLLLSAESGNLFPEVHRIGMRHVIFENYHLTPQQYKIQQQRQERRHAQGLQPILQQRVTPSHVIGGDKLTTVTLDHCSLVTLASPDAECGDLDIITSTGLDVMDLSYHPHLRSLSISNSYVQHLRLHEDALLDLLRLHSVSRLKRISGAALSEASVFEIVDCPRLEDVSVTQP